MPRLSRGQLCLWVFLLISICSSALYIHSRYSACPNHGALRLMAEKMIRPFAILCGGFIIRYSIQAVLNTIAQRPADAYLTPHQTAVSDYDTGYTNESHSIMICENPSCCVYVPPPISATRAEIKGIDIYSSTTNQKACLCMQHLDKTGKIQRKLKVYSGGCSDVYTGTLDDTLPVALKVIRIRTKPGTTHDEERRRLHRRFTKMLQLSSRLDHPSITPLRGFAMGSDMDDLPMLIFPWYDAGNVVQFLKYNPSASRPHLFQDVVRGLAYIHSKSLVHGDIKGENILVNDAGHACLADFGISSFIQADDAPSVDSQTTAIPLSSNSTSSSALRGTVSFLSPEELMNGGRKKMPSDVWKTGCTAIQIIAGNAPYEGITNHRELVLKITDGVFPMDVQQYATSPEECKLWKIIEQCWKLEPESRPSADILCAQIEKTIEEYFPSLTLPQ